MRRRERLVQVEVHHIEPHVPGACNADERVEVGAVVVDERTRLVGETGNLHDVLLEDAQGVGIGQHHRRDR